MQPKRHVVTLNWDDEKGLMPDPEPILLSPNDTIFFRAGVLPPGFTGAGAVRVAFEPQTCLSRGTFHENDGMGDIEVQSALPHALHYDCELLLDGIPQPQPDKTSGGTGKPVGGGGGGDSGN
jgi:hypothetical protein